MIESLDIYRNMKNPLLAAARPKIIPPPPSWLIEVPPKRRVSLHIAAVTLPARKPARARWWPYVAWALRPPPAFALACVAAAVVLRRGL